MKLGTAYPSNDGVKDGLFLLRQFSGWGVGAIILFWVYGMSHGPIEQWWTRRATAYTVIEHTKQRDRELFVLTHGDRVFTTVCVYACTVEVGQTLHLNRDDKDTLSATDAPVLVITDEKEIR